MHKTRIFHFSIKRFCYCCSSLSNFPPASVRMRTQTHFVCVFFSFFGWKNKHTELYITLKFCASSVNIRTWHKEGTEKKNHIVLSHAVPQWCVDGNHQWHKMLSMQTQFVCLHGTDSSSSTTTNSYCLISPFPLLLLSHTSTTCVACLLPLLLPLQMRACVHACMCICVYAVIAVHTPVFP